MPNVITYDVFVDGVKFNNAPIRDTGTTQIVLDGLPSDYAPEIRIVARDSAGNETSYLVDSPSARTTAHSPSDPLSSSDLAKVDAIIAASMTESGQRGIIVGTTGPRGTLMKAYGNTAASGGRPLTIDDHFRCASTTKGVTAWAFLMQMDQGRISLDDKLSQFVPDVPNGDTITMRHLLQMRSGAADYLKNPLVGIIFTIFPTWGWTDTGVDALAFIKGPSTFAPGTKYEYNNGNCVLIGLCVQAVDPAHRHIRDIIAQDILAPLGMTETQWPRNSNIPQPAASSQVINPELFGCSGALTSTVSDMLKWTAEQRDHTLLSEDAWLEYTDIYRNFYGYPFGFDDPIPARYGYGLYAQSTGRWIGHQGGMVGYSLAPNHDPETGACIVVSENVATTSPAVAAWTRITREMAKALYPGSIAEPVPSYPIPPEAQ